MDDTPPTPSCVGVKVMCQLGDPTDVRDSGIRVVAGRSCRVRVGVRVGLCVTCFIAVTCLSVHHTGRGVGEMFSPKDLNVRYQGSSDQAAEAFYLFFHFTFFSCRLPLVLAFGVGMDVADRQTDQTRRSRKVVCR
ncbi:hypothetical protein K435DRAFT_374196 [Dendrothele bispora CBS 962.96]|uniref:Uncharacterized protein n=1 Tax=Dendrothele bispora (strain CBS 962.96) TaxID=1314807 RepID=A0A4S8LBG7_DENBC|nr:hypothetical protein K435DRAFT_374196 [Dendrothele bispora CBS 962.96]